MRFCVLLFASSLGEFSKIRIRDNSEKKMDKISLKKNINRMKKIE
jgi:hypothetical protein